MVDDEDVLTQLLSLAQNLRGERVLLSASLMRLNASALQPKTHGCQPVTVKDWLLGTSHV
jgi:hypothetical protein